MKTDLMQTQGGSVQLVKSFFILSILPAFISSGNAVAAPGVILQSNEITQSFSVNRLVRDEIFELADMNFQLPDQEAMGVARVEVVIRPGQGGRAEISILTDGLVDDQQVTDGRTVVLFPRTVKTMDRVELQCRGSSYVESINVTFAAMDGSANPGIINKLFVFRQNFYDNGWINLGPKLRNDLNLWNKYVNAVEVRASASIVPSRIDLSVHNIYEGSFYIGAEFRKYRIVLRNPIRVQDVDNLMLNFRSPSNVQLDSIVLQIDDGNR